MATAQYFDGLTARRRAVDVTLSGSSVLELRGEDGRVVDRWQLSEMRRVPGTQRGVDELRAMKKAGDEARLALYDPELIKAIVKAAPKLDRPVKAPGDMRRALLAWGAVAVGATAAIVFIAAPLLADQLARIIPPESEIALGQSLADEIVAQGVPAMEIRPGACDAPEGRAALDKMVARLETAAGAHVPLTVRVLDSPVVNAFALPGGQIFLMRGLLDNARSPDEVAGVLAHEIGHVVALDPTRSALRGAASGVVVAYVLGDVVGGVAAAGMVAAVIDARFSREAEAGADRIAVEILNRAELPIDPFAGFFARLRELYGDSSTFLDSHPQSSQREAMVRAAAADGFHSDSAVSLAPGEWRALQRICGGSSGPSGRAPSGPEKSPIEDHARPETAPIDASAPDKNSGPVPEPAVEKGSANK